MSVTFSGFKLDGDTFRTVRLPGDEEDPIGFNLANGNAIAFLRFLGFPIEEQTDLWGRADIPAVRRALIRANAQFDKRVVANERPTETHGHLVIDGVTHLDIPRFHAKGIDADYFDRRLVEFSKLVEDCATHGATHIGWS
jgi:hypothetical protein